MDQEHKAGVEKIQLRQMMGRGIMAMGPKCIGAKPDLFYVKNPIETVGEFTGDPVGESVGEAFSIFVADLD